MSTDTWLHTVRQLCGEVDRLTAILEEGSIIAPRLRLQDSGQGWELVFEEVWANDRDGVYTAPVDFTMFKDRFNWVDEQLKKQKNCFRSDSGAWRFCNKQEAEHFLTLYYLKWSPG